MTFLDLPLLERSITSMAMLREGRDIALRCPVCGCDDVHPMRVVVLEFDGTKTSIARREVKQSRSAPCNNLSRRGVRITIRAGCEQGHVFDLALQFHKGKTYVEAIQRDDPESFGAGAWAQVPEFERN